MPDHPHHQDAAGADAGDGAAPAAPGGLRAVTGLDASGLRSGAYVDVYDTRHPSDILHVAADEFAAFVADAKACRYDYLVPDELKRGE